MFAKFAIVACAIASFSTVTKAIVCEEGEYSISVEGTGDFCATGPAWELCSGTINGTCPYEQSGLESGSHCALIHTQVFGCRRGPYEEYTAPEEASFVCLGNKYGSIPVSVVGADVYCADEPICAGNSSTGNCPVAQGELTVDSVCSQISEDVYGCVLPEN